MKNTFSIHFVYNSMLLHLHFICDLQNVPLCIETSSTLKHLIMKFKTFFITSMFYIKTVITVYQNWTHDHQCYLFLSRIFVLIPDGQQITLLRIKQQLQHQQISSIVHMHWEGNQKPTYQSVKMAIWKTK